MTKKAETSSVKIRVTKDGPYIVEGDAPIQEKFLAPDEEGYVASYTEGETFHTNAETPALCRCGKSKNKPFCDGSHLHNHFDGECTASHEPILSNAEAFKGPHYTLLDNDAYCAFARFCDANGRVWNLVRNGDKKSDELAVKEALACPAGRLMIKDNKTGAILEAAYDPAINIIQDPILNVEGPIALQGDIEVIDENGEPFEKRCRQTLCRCGRSRNKPFCDGMHAAPKEE